MNKEHLFDIIASICPDHLAEEWDNCGIQVNTASTDVSKVLVSLEITEDVIQEARNNNCGLILTHHPLIFDPLTSIDNNNYIGNYIHQLINSDISVYSCHTSFDAMDGGNNDHFGKVCGFVDVHDPFNDYRMLRKGMLPEEMKLPEIIAYLAEKLDVDQRFFRATGDPEKKLKSVSWCTGSGASYIDIAFSEGVDLFITGDVKYHDAQKALALGLAVLDAGHFATEKIFTSNMAQLLEDRICEEGANIEVLRSKVHLDPFI